MSRSTKQDTVVKYALLRGKLVPRDDVLKDEVNSKVKVQKVEEKEESVEKSAPKTPAKPKQKETAKKAFTKPAVNSENKDEFSI